MHLLFVKKKTCVRKYCQEIQGCDFGSHKYFISARCVALCKYVSLVSREVCCAILLSTGFHLCVSHWDHRLQWRCRGLQENQLWGHRCLCWFPLLSSCLVSDKDEEKHVQGKGSYHTCTLRNSHFQCEMSNNGDLTPVLLQYHYHYYQSINQ